MSGTSAWTFARGMRRLFIALSVVYWLSAMGWAWSDYKATVAVDSIDDMTADELLDLIHKYDAISTPAPQPKVEGATAMAKPQQTAWRAVDALPANAPHWARRAVRGVWSALRPLTICAIAYAAICAVLGGLAWVARGFRMAT